jgi:hypothetical protein
MARAKKHKDVEFVVEGYGGKGSKTSVFSSFDNAAGYAVAGAASTGIKHHIDVIVWSKAGARWYGGDDAAEMYEDDPDASIFERLTVDVSDEGKIP